jgi:hypothetical protein
VIHENDGARPEIAMESEVESMRQNEEIDGERREGGVRETMEEAIDSEDWFTPEEGHEPVRETEELQEAVPSEDQEGMSEEDRFLDEGSLEVGHVINAADDEITDLEDFLA